MEWHAFGIVSTSIIGIITLITSIGIMGIISIEGIVGPFVRDIFGNISSTRAYFSFTSLVC